MKEELEKSGWQLPCNGCGLCCKEEICMVGQEIFGLWIGDGPCPGLIRERGKYRCLLVKLEAAMPVEKKLGEALGIGKGCCADQFRKPKAQHA